MTVKKIELTFTILQGKAEEKFLKKAVADIKTIRTKLSNKSSNNKSRSGKK
jgi:hypothetical protein